MKRQGFNHRKVRRLSQLIGGDHPDAVARGIIEGLAYVAATYAPTGDLSAVPWVDIALEVGWTGDPEVLRRYLGEAGWIDTDAQGRDFLHDWSEHADKYVHRTLIRKGATFADGISPRLTEGTREEREAWLRATGAESGDPGGIPAGSQKVNTGSKPEARSQKPVEEHSVSPVGDVESRGSGSTGNTRKPPSADALRIAGLLRDELASHVEHFRPPAARAFDGWVRQVDLLLRKDAAPVGDVEAVVRWVVHDDFWSANILSGKKLRQHFTKLHAKRRSESNGPNGRPSARNDEGALTRAARRFGERRGLRSEPGERAGSHGPENARVVSET